MTDSNYISFPHLKNSQESWDYAEKVAKEISALFPPPISLDFECSIYDQFLILSKKRYMYTSCGRDGIVGNKIGKRGVILARRDNSVFVRTLYEQVIDKIFKHVPSDDILYFILQEINKLCSNSLDVKNFVITKSVGDTAGFSDKTKESQYLVKFQDEKKKWKGKIGSYTVPLLPENEDERQKQIQKKGAINEKDYYEKSLPAQVQLAEKIRRRGGRIENGSRIQYVIIEYNDGHKGKQYEKIEGLEYFQAHNNILKIDFLYYLEALINPMDQVLNVMYDKDDPNEKYKFKKDFIDRQFNFRYKVRTKVIEEINNLRRPKLVFID